MLRTGEFGVNAWVEAELRVADRDSVTSAERSSVLYPLTYTDTSLFLLKCQIGTYPIYDQVHLPTLEAPPFPTFDRGQPVFRSLICTHTIDIITLILSMTHT